MKIASERAEPIPVYAEMSSINPVVLLPAALAQRAESLGRDFVNSLTMGVGQFCTNPGFVIGIDGPDLQRFIAAAGESVQAVVPATMLTPGIHGAYERGVNSLLERKQMQLIARRAVHTAVVQLCSASPRKMFSAILPSLKKCSVLRPLWRAALMKRNWFVSLNISRANLRQRCIWNRQTMHWLRDWCRRWNARRDACW
jgi:hypothetical protein